MTSPLKTGFIIALLAVSNTALAIKPSAAQIEQFKNLSAAEQKTLAAQFGYNLDDIKANLAGDGATDNTPQTPIEVVTPREVEVIGGAEAIEDNAAKAAQDDDTKLEDNEQSTRTVKRQLKQYGYDLFAGSPTTFAPANHIPVPLDYVIGPGDTVVVQLYGKENAIHEITIDREGVLQFPGIGPMPINGLNFKELKARIVETVTEQMIGVKANVTMGALRSIQVFVLGEAHRPGAYTVSALSTMTHALFVSGGISTVGSLRQIQLKRKGQVMAKLDLYNLLLKGDTSADQRLQPGDVIFIPPIGQTAGITGEVNRPAIYELNKEATVGQLLELSGGLLPTAYPKASRIDRINRNGDRTFAEVNLASKKGKKTAVRNGDVVQIYSVLDKVEDAVLLSGHVHRPGGFAWRHGMRVSEVIRHTGDLLPNADMQFALIKRQTPPNRLLTTLQFSLSEALANKRGTGDPVLKAKDELMVFNLGENHADALVDTVETLELQVPVNEYPQIVHAYGNVKYPGTYPLTEGMTVEDLIAAAAGVLPKTELMLALVARTNGETGEITVERTPLNQRISLTKPLTTNDELYVLGLDEAREELLEPLIESLNRPRKTDLTNRELARVVQIDGAVRYPGQYPLLSSMTVQDLIVIAGGFSQNAFSLQAEITREKVSSDEQFISTHQQLELSQPGENGLGLVLAPRDRLVVKQIPNWGEQSFVELEGEVMFPGRYPVNKGETLRELVARAGGLTEFADPAASIFMRDSLKEKEQELLEKYREQVEKDVAKMEAESQIGEQTQLDQAQLAGAGLLERLGEVEASGRLVINLEAILTDNEDINAKLVLRDGDSLVVPRIRQEVSILGEVHFPTSHLYASNLSAKKYVDLSGGVTRFGDKKRAYVIRRNGQVEPITKRYLWVFPIRAKVEPGDTIVVPADTDLASPMDYWMSVSQILFQLATTAAALDTVGAL